MSKLRDVLSLLIAAEPLPPRLNDHTAIATLSQIGCSYSGPQGHPFGLVHVNCGGVT